MLTLTHLIRIPARSAAANQRYSYTAVLGAVAVGLVRAAAILGGATDGGDAAVLQDYHAGLVPPFCLSAVKAFFDAH